MIRHMTGSGTGPPQTATDPRPVQLTTKGKAN
jgi:hypothetical protein